MTKRKSKKRQYGITLDMAQEHLEQWLEAELVLTTSQSYTLGTKTLTRANLSSIRQEIEYWRGMVAKLESQQSNGGRNRMMRIVPRDW